MHTNAATPHAPQEVDTAHLPFPYRRTASLGWILVSLFGTLLACHWAVLGLHISISLLALLPGDVPLWLLPALAGGSSGLLLAAIQLLFVHDLEVRRRAWFLASVLGGALGAVLGVQLSLTYFLERLINNDLLTRMLPGLAWASTVGGAQWFALRREVSLVQWAPVFLAMSLTGALVSVELIFLFMRALRNSVWGIG